MRVCMRGCITRYFPPRQPRTGREAVVLEAALLADEVPEAAQQLGLPRDAEG